MEKKTTEDTASKKAVKQSMSDRAFDYYKVEFKLIREMLGSCPEASIYNTHVIEKMKKEIRIANSLQKKITKAMQKYVGPEITEDKQIQELKAIVRNFLAFLGEPIELPDTIEELLVTIKEVETLFNEKVGTGEDNRCTVFMVDENKWPMISSHMVLGNLKENLRIMVNNGDKSIMTSKVSVGESLALDIKPVEPFMRASKDIVRDAEGVRVLCERPLKYTDQMGKVRTCISRSECLPEGTEFVCTLRVRKGSPWGYKELFRLFEMGRSNGLGQWRGSGNKGAYQFKLTHLPDYVEPTYDGWN